MTEWNLKSSFRRSDTDVQMENVANAIFYVYYAGFNEVAVHTINVANSIFSAKVL